MRLQKISINWKVVAFGILGLILIWQIVSGIITKSLQPSYEKQGSQIFTDRNGKLISLLPNERGYYNQFLADVPPKFAELLLKKEDRWFYWHPGFNPYSWARDFFAWVFIGKRSGSSTLSQQLVKILLANEGQRSFKNKIKEFFYTESLEWQLSKKQILTMYLNSIYFGNLSQGLKQASLDYFNLPPENLNEAQMLTLISALNSPSNIQPKTAQNLNRAKKLAAAFNLDIPEASWQQVLAANDTQNFRTSETAFEVKTLNLNCQKNCRLTLDSQLSQNIRQILNRNLKLSTLDTAANGAVVIIKLPENEILSIIGSPDPTLQGLGMQLNMATKPRAIGSTAKPFIYLKAFEAGARPYSLVLDEEIKYQIATGFDFFPKNFDGQFRGPVTLHQALDNSLNIPSVQVLEFVGLNNFYKFLRETLGFVSIQPLENYELGIALGGMESDLLTLSHLFTIFPQQGWLKPLTLYKAADGQSAFYQALMEQNLNQPKQVGKKEMVELVNKILNDRETGIDQFGLKSNLNLPFTNYALKTGTSRDYHDSWTIGYTPDFLVGVWVGNSDNKAMRQITGLSGAAKIWHEVMLTMYNSTYNKNTPFDFKDVQFIPSGHPSRLGETSGRAGVETLDFALAGDNYSEARNILIKDKLILTPHDGDKFLLQPGTTLPLSASADVTWSINGKFFGKGQKLTWPAKQAGNYTITAETADGKKEQIIILINEDE